MTNKNEPVRFTYRLSKELFNKIKEEACKKNVTVNSEINNVLWEHYMKDSKTAQKGGRNERK